MEDAIKYGISNKTDEAFLDFIKSKCKVAYVTQLYLIEQLHLTPTTYYKHMATPWLFSVEHVIIMAEVLGLHSSYITDVINQYYIKHLKEDEKIQS